MKNKILVIEDDNNLGSILTEYLNVKGFEAKHCFNGEDGLREFGNNSYDLCLVDIMMPKMDGFTFVREIKKISTMPFIFLTAKSLLEDKVEGFTLGADDYVTKPFSMEELILRINAVLNRVKQNNIADVIKEIQIGGYLFDYTKRILKINDKEQKLTSKEVELLKMLCENKNEILERSNALLKIWKNENYFTSRSMDVYIAKLRGYLKNDPAIQILNIHGTGFKLIVNEYKVNLK